MMAQILGHSIRSGYYVGIVYSMDEIEAMLSAGIDDFREVSFLEKERAEAFRDRWNRMYGNGEYWEPKKIKIFA